MAPSVPNPNWPNLFASANFGNNPFYTPNASEASTDVSPRLQRSWSVRRGKQFEIDQVQPGEFHGEWGNKDGALDPTNTAGPYVGGVLPYRGYQMQAVYPPSVNLLTADQATGGEGTPVAPGSVPASMNVGTDVGGSTLTIAASGTAFQGTQVFQSAMPASATVNLYIIKFTLQPVLSPTAWISATYTWSTYVRCTTTSVNPSVAAAVKFYDINGNYIADYSGGTSVLTGSPTATWTRVSVTQAPPAGAAYCAVAVALKGTPPGSTWTLQMDGSQLEQGGAASAFVVPGVNYPVFSGLIERYPQSWDYSGTYGVVQPVCVDTMALLSQTILKEAFVMDVVATGPAWFFQFNEPSGSTAFSEQAGRVPGQAGVFSASLGAGTLTAGSAITAAAPSGKFFGTNGPVVTVNNPNANQGTVIDMTPSGVTSPPTSGAWTRMIAYRCGQTTGTPVFAAYSPGINPSSFGYSGNMFWGLLHNVGGSSTAVAVTFYNAAGQFLGVNSSIGTNDNNWHLNFVQMSADGKTVGIYSAGTLTTNTGANDMHSSLVVNESVGGDMYKLDGTVGFGSTNFVGDVALYAQWNSLLTTAQMGALRDSFMSAYVSESTDSRYQRILNWAGYQGVSRLDPGVTTSITYANDVAGTDALTALQSVVDTEGGRHFVAGDGSINFQSRQRYFQLGSLVAGGTPRWVFGEDAAGGEIPYTDLSFDFDPTRVSNQVAVTQNSTGQIFTANDPASQQGYGVRNLTRNSQSTNGEEVRESAFALLSRFKDPHLRVQALKVNVAGNPATFSSALAFEIGHYVQINRRDPAGIRPQITMHGFIEQITHTGDDSLAWTVDLEISPSAATPFATFTSLRTTLNASASSGQPTITINALPDAATNPVRSQLTGGQIMTITGGGNSETLTIATGGVQDQLAGYSTATVTFTANLAHTYSSGSAVVEATGANYDALAAFDSVQFAY